MRRLFIIQIMLVLLATCVVSVVNIKMAPSVLYGGMSCFLPTLLFAYFFFSRKHKRRSGQILIVFYIGELMKMIISALIMVAAIYYLHAAVIPIVAGFLLANMVFWLAPTLALKQQMRST